MSVQKMQIKISKTAMSELIDFFNTIYNETKFIQNGQTISLDQVSLKSGKIERHTTRQLKYPDINDINYEKPIIQSNNGSILSENDHHIDKDLINRKLENFLAKVFESEQPLNTNYFPFKGAFLGLQDLKTDQKIQHFNENSTLVFRKLTVKEIYICTMLIIALRSLFRKGSIHENLIPMSAEKIIDEKQSPYNIKYIKHFKKYIFDVDNSSEGLVFNQINFELSNKRVISDHMSYILSNNLIFYDLFSFYH